MSGRRTERSLTVKTKVVGMISYPGQSRGESEPGGDKLVPLLEERSRLEERLRQIDLRGKEIDPEVVRRVSADYRSRLEYLRSEITRQARLLESTLSSYRELIDLLERGIELGERSLDELKVRSALGEYSGEDLERIGREKKDKVEYYRGKSRSYRANVERIEGVLGQIAKA